jgi:hypothetical protein
LIGIVDLTEGLAMTRIVCVAIGLLLLATTAKAEYAISGLGAKSCGDLANEYRRNPSIETEMLVWAWGYWSGANAAIFESDKSYRDLDTPVEAQKQSLLIYCDAHPMAMFVMAVKDAYSKFPLKKYSPASTSR